MEQARPIRRALLSVSDKTGILEFAKALDARGVALFSPPVVPPSCWPTPACR